MPPFVWNDGFQRQVLWCATFGDLLAKYPGAFQSRMFAPDDGRETVPSPRLRLARLLETFKKAPGADIMDGLVDGLARTLSNAERQAFENEWQDVRLQSAPSSWEFIEEQVSYWAKRAALVQAILRSSDILKEAGGIEQIDQVFGLLDRAKEAGSPNISELIPIFASVDDQVAWWRKGEDDLYRIPTGFAPLDRVIGGGILPGEVFYFLAPPKGAKTSSLTSVALGAVRARFNVAFFSFEMMTSPMRARFDRSISRASKQELREDPLRLKRAVEGYQSTGAGELFLWTGVPQQRDSVEEIVRAVERTRQDGHRIDLLCLDYLNIMGSTKVAKEREKRHELAQISREISAAAKTLEVGTWSAALVNRQAVDKKVVRKTDIGESLEVVAVADGMVAVCAPKELRQRRLRRFFLAALREEEDERWAGTYHFDGGKMTFTAVPDPPEEEEGGTTNGGNQSRVAANNPDRPV